MSDRTCLTLENHAPKCRRDHRLKQDPRWKVDQLPDGTFRWTTPAGGPTTPNPPGTRSSRRGDSQRMVAGVTLRCITLVWGGAMMAGPGDEMAAAAGPGRGDLRASHADREQVIGTLKAAFVQGMLAKDEFD